MTDSKITQLPVATTISASDILLKVGNTSTLPETQQITLEDFRVGLNSLNGVSGSTITESDLSLSDVTTANASSSKHGLLPKLSGSASQALLGDGSFGNPTPAGHASGHKSGGTDAIKLDELATPTDVTTLDANSTQHGLAIKVSSTASQKLISTGTQQSYIDDDSGFSVIIGDGTNVITTGVKGYLEVPVNCEIQSIRLVADASGSIVIDIWKDTYANFPPVVGDAITGTTGKPTLSTAQKSEITSLTYALTKGDWLAFNVDSATTVKQVTLSFMVRITATS